MLAPRLPTLKAYGGLQLVFFLHHQEPIEYCHSDVVSEQGYNTGISVVIINNSFLSCRGNSMIQKSAIP